MTSLNEIKDTLRLYATHQQHPTQVDEAHAALKGCGELVIDGLIWALRQDDIDLKLLALQLLQEHFTDAQRAGFASQGVGIVARCRTLEFGLRHRRSDRRRGARTTRRLGQRAQQLPSVGPARAQPALSVRCGGPRARPSSRPRCRC